VIGVFKKLESDFFNKKERSQRPTLSQYYKLLFYYTMERNELQGKSAIFFPSGNRREKGAGYWDDIL